MKIDTIEKIEEMIATADKKVHAGEWLRIEQVRILMNKLCIWMIEQHQQDLRDIKHHILSGQNNILNKGEEE